MKSLGGIFERKQCLHIARRTRRKFQLHFEPPCWKQHMQCIKGPQWLMGFSNCEQRRKNRKKKKHAIRRDSTHECHEPQSKRLSIILGPISFTSQLRKMAYPAKPYYNLTHDQPHPTRTHTHTHILFVFYKDWSTIITCLWVAMLI